MREKRLVLRGGEWTATRDLWSSGLRAVLEAHLESLDDATRDALEIIAIVGVADIDTASQLVDWGTLELLEERRMITFIPSGDRQLVAVMPPLLVEFFRHEPLTARRTRLTSQIVRQLSTPESVWSVLTDQQSSPTSSGGQDALFVRLLQERARARRIVTAAEWEANPTAASAVRYIRALMHTHTAKVRDVIADVLSSPATRTGDDASRAEFAALKAEWTAYVDDDLQRAVAQLQDDAQTVGAHAGMLRAAEVQLLANLDTVPADFGNRLEVSDELPPTVKLMMLETQMSVLVSLGRFTDALRVFGLIEALENEEQRHTPGCCSAWRCSARATRAPLSTCCSADSTRRTAISTSTLCEPSAPPHRCVIWQQVIMRPSTICSRSSSRRESPHPCRPECSSRYSRSPQWSPFDEGR